MRWWSNAVNFSCLCFRAALRMPANPWDTPLPHCVGHVWDGLAFSLVHALPSPLSADGWPPVFAGFLGTLPWSDASETCTEAVWRLAFASRSGRCERSDISKVSRFSCRTFLDVPGVLDDAGSERGSRWRPRRVAFRCSRAASAPRWRLFDVQ